MLCGHGLGFRGSKERCPQAPRIDLGAVLIAPSSLSAKDWSWPYQEAATAFILIKELPPAGKSCQPTKDHGEHRAATLHHQTFLCPPLSMPGRWDQAWDGARGGTGMGLLPKHLPPSCHNGQNRQRRQPEPSHPFIYGFQSSLLWF